MPSPHPQLTAALAALADAEPDYTEAREMYEGRVDEVFASEKLRHLFAASGRKLRVNYARTPVDVLVERTSVQGITCSDNAQKTILDLAWFDNELGIEAKDVHRRAYEYGDAYLIAWPDEDLPGKVSSYAHDPTDVRVFYDPQRPRVKSHAVHGWLEAADEDNGLRPGVWHRVEMYYPDRVEKWVSKTAVVSEGGLVRGLEVDDEYEPYEGDGDVDGIAENPTPGVIPVFHFRTARPYGRPEHADAYGPQHGINKLVTSLFGVVDRNVLPQRYVQVDDAEKQQFAQPTPDALFEPDPDVPVTERTTSKREGGHDLGTDPGDVWVLRGTQRNGVGQFDGADPKTLTDPMLVLVQAMADVTDMPANRYHRGGQSPAADSQRMDEAPLRSKTADRHAQFGVTWREWCAYVLLVNGVPTTDAQIAWAPPETYNDKSSWESAHLQLQAGVPYAQVLLERGYVADTVAEWETQLPGGVPPLLAAKPDVVQPAVEPADQA